MPAELVFHDFREAADFDRALRARDVVPFRRIELDLLLTETTLVAPEPEPQKLDVARLFAFARERGFELFIHLVDASAYTAVSLALLRARLREEGRLGPGTIIGSTHVAGLLRVSEEVPEVSNQGRFPVPGVRYVHKFGPDLLRALDAAPAARFASTSRALETLFDVEVPAARRDAYESMALIASFDAIDRRTGVVASLDEYAAGAERLARLPVLDLLITNGLKLDAALPRLARMGFRSST